MKVTERDFESHFTRAAPSRARAVNLQALQSVHALFESESAGECRIHGQRYAVSRSWRRAKRENADAPKPGPW
jgi:hypothetical protein